MPKCLECGNKKKFYYTEINTNLGIYDEDTGVFLDVEDNWYDKAENGRCYECGSGNIEGEV